MPETGVTLLPAISAIRTHVVTLVPEGYDDHNEIEPDAYDLARSGWKREPEERFGKQREVLGSLGGSPSCLEDDRLPACPSCTGTMEFAAHLEEGISTQTAMNLGGQLGYVFVCRACPSRRPQAPSGALPGRTSPFRNVAVFLMRGSAPVGGGQAARRSAGAAASRARHVSTPPVHNLNS